MLLSDFGLCSNDIDLSYAVDLNVDIADYAFLSIQCPYQSNSHNLAYPGTIFIQDMHVDPDDNRKHDKWIIIIGSFDCFFIYHKGR